MPSGRDAGGSDDGELKDARAGEGTDRGERGHRKPRSTRLCCLCPQERGPIGLPVAVDPVVSKGGCAPPPLGHFAGPFLPDRDGIASTWVHDSCVMWCPEVYFDQRKQRLKNVTSALKRGSYIKCNHCGLKGATVGCTLPQCPKSYHLACAHAAGSRFNAEAFTVLCPDHGADRKRAPAPLWSKTMNGDPATFLNGDEPRSPHAPIERPKAQTERPGLRRSKRKRLQAKGEVPREEDKDRADMHSQAEKILAAVMAAGQRLRKEEEHVSDDEEAFAKRERRRTVKDKSRIPCVTVGGSFRGGGVDGDEGVEEAAGLEPGHEALVDPTGLHDHEAVAVRQVLADDAVEDASLPARAGARSAERDRRWERRGLGESGGGRACVVQRALPKARPREPGTGTGRSMHVEAPQAQEVEKDVGDVGGERGHQCRRAPTQNHSTNDDDGPLEPRQGHPRPGRHAHVVEERSGLPRDVGGERGREIGRASCRERV